MESSLQGTWFCLSCIFAWCSRDASPCLLLRVLNDKAGEDMVADDQIPGIENHGIGEAGSSSVVVSLNCKIN